MQKQNLDFLIIGAAKSGTTTLYEWMRYHPELYLPAGKELPFFTDDNLYSQGITQYLRHNFNAASEEASWGKVTPQYMSGEHEIPPREVARRIHETNPQMKLIAVLRHPIERAFSDYKMAVRRGYKTRSFSDSIDTALNSKTLDNERDNPTEKNRFLVASEYGRILNDYLGYFPFSQILVLFAEELQTHPEATLGDIFSFLEVDAHFVPPNISTNYHRGGSEARLKLLTPRTIYKIPFVQYIWEHWVPYNIRRRVSFRINQWNIKPDETSLDRNSEAYKKLVDFYADDVKTLQSSFHTSAPWEDFK